MTWLDTVWPAICIESKEWHPRCWCYTPLASLALRALTLRGITFSRTGYGLHSRLLLRPSVRILRLMWYGTFTRTTDDLAGYCTQHKTSCKVHSTLLYTGYQGSKSSLSTLRPLQSNLPHRISLFIAHIASGQ